MGNIDNFWLITRFYTSFEVTINCQYPCMQGFNLALTVDEHMTVAQACQVLAKKRNIKRDSRWILMEVLTSLYMTRIYEDHEMLAENLAMWGTSTNYNELRFLPTDSHYDLFKHPELYLLGMTTSQVGLELNDEARNKVVEEYFSTSDVYLPEVDGMLWLKEKKKHWRKFVFYLQKEGLYYYRTPAPGVKKEETKKLLLANFKDNLVYHGIQWDVKWAALTRFCFALKPLQIQNPDPLNIKYLCAEDEVEKNKWMTGIRIVKYGRLLYVNYKSLEDPSTRAFSTASAKVALGTNLLLIFLYSVKTSMDCFQM